MDRREALRKQVADQPLQLIEHTLELEAQLAQAQAQVAELEAQLAEAQAYIEELQRRLLRNKAESLSPQQEPQLGQLRNDLLEQAQRPGPLSPQVLEEEEKPPPRRPSRPHRHPLPESLRTETVTLEPETTTCPHCGRAQNRIGEEVTEETRLGSGPADSPPDRPAQVRLSLWRIAGPRALTAALGPAEQAGSGAGGVYRLDAL